jgi:RNA polymerase sigma-70 factor (ECF subfamily)
MVGNNSTALKSFAFNFTRNLEDAEDLMQDTLLKALRYKDNFQDGTNFKGWLFTIMRNIFINNYKRKQLQNTWTDNSVNQHTLVNHSCQEVNVLQQLSEKDIWNAIHTLPEEYSKPFRMFIEGFHYEEIAAEMNIPMGTVKSRIFHARKRLSDTLSDFR